jgi:hypothetical protein
MGGTMLLSRGTRTAQERLPEPESAVPVPGPSGWTAVESLGRAVFAVLDTGGRADYTKWFEEFREDPQGVVKPALTPAVGSGVTVTSALLYVLPVAAWLVKAVAERLAGQAVDTLGQTLRTKIGRLLEDRHGGAVPALDPDEEQVALAALAAWARGVGADAEQAGTVARAVIAVLRVPGRAPAPRDVALPLPSPRGPQGCGGEGRSPTRRKAMQGFSRTIVPACNRRVRRCAACGRRSSSPRSSCPASSSPCSS